MAEILAVGSRAVDDERDVLGGHDDR
jgi:hypothetical protein